MSNERKGRRSQKRRPIRVAWRSGRVHYVGEVAVTGLAAIDLDRSAMVFTMVTMCGREIPRAPVPVYGAYIQGDPPTCRNCEARYASLPEYDPPHNPTPGGDSSPR